MVLDGWRKIWSLSVAAEFFASVVSATALIAGA